MKHKKVTALLVSVVFMLSLLAGCAGGEAKVKNELDLSAVNAIVQEKGCDVQVTSSSALKRAVQEAADLVAAYDAGEVAEGMIQYQVAQRLDSWDKGIGVSPRLVTAEELQADAESSLEEMAADIVLSMDQILKQVKYEAAAVQATTRDDVVCWIIVVIYYL